MTTKDIEIASEQYSDLSFRHGFHYGAHWAKQEISNEPLYEFIYNPCIHESAASTISVHRSRKGAEMAMDFHKAEALKEFNEMYEDYLSPFHTEFGKHEYWGVREIKIEE